ncbi:MAG: AAA family ATPase [Deltaproteobacteria bacterium]|nr:MAG: AAA family ATPase [Deltaproteobacteria bacterium]
MTPEDLVARWNAGDLTLVVLAADEDAVLDLADAAAAGTGRTLRIWTATDPGPSNASDLDTLLVALDARPADEVWLVLDAARQPLSPGARRRLRDRIAAEAGPALVFVQDEPFELATIPDLPIEILPPPGREVLADEARALLDVDDAVATALAEAGLGLSRLRFRRLLARLARGSTAAPSALDRALLAAKGREVAAAGHLAFAEPVAVDLVGGARRVKAWLALRSRAFSPRAREAGIPWPKGLLLLGPPGCGKSLLAKASADALGLPLLRLDPGRLFAGTVGASEANLRATLATVERAAPCVVWIDEVEKGFAGSDAGRSDAGTAARVVGTFLTWLEERDRPVFVVATANRLAGLPPEFVRPGRFDGRFFVDLPDAEARREILDVHLRRRPARDLGRVPPLGDPIETFLALADGAEGCTGAELASAVGDARLVAFAEGRVPKAADLEAALARTVPAARLYAEEIADLRRFAQDRLTWA